MGEWVFCDCDCGTYNIKMQQREEKQLETALESIIQRVNDLKNSIMSMIFKVENEYESINWPTFLDNYALISGQVTYSKI